MRGADGAEEYVGDNLGRLAVGLDLLGCWDWKGGVTESQSKFHEAQVVGSQRGGWAGGRGGAAGGYARPGRATAGGRSRVDRTRGNGIETRAPRAGDASGMRRGPREKRPRPPSVEAAGCQ